MKVHLFVREETDTQTHTHTHERDAGLIEGVIEPAAWSKELFSISKHSRTRGAAENTGDFNESPLYTLMMCKYESNNTESHNIGDTHRRTNDRALGPQRSRPVRSSHTDFAPPPPRILLTCTMCCGVSVEDDWIYQSGSLKLSCRWSFSVNLSNNWQILLLTSLKDLFLSLKLQVSGGRKLLHIFSVTLFEYFFISVFFLYYIL